MTRVFRREKKLGKISTIGSAGYRNPAVILSDRRESKDLRTDLTAQVPSVRRFFDSADAPLRMTNLRHSAVSSLPTQFNKHIVKFPQ